MVLESVVADLLNRFLGDYVENLDKSQLKLGIWGGKEPGTLRGGGRFLTPQRVRPPATPVRGGRAGGFSGGASLQPLRREGRALRGPPTTPRGAGGRAAAPLPLLPPRL